MFKASGKSMVQDVIVTGLATTGDNEISVSLAYNGTGDAPSVTIIALTNHGQLMGMMMGGSGSMGGMMMGPDMMGMNGMGMMSSGSMPGWQHPDMQRWNATQWQHWHSQMTHQMNAQSWQMQSQSGSAVLESGWQSEANTVTIVLDGDTSVNGASDIFAVVFPHLT
jgi:hypothetical protein